MRSESSQEQSVGPEAPALIEARAQALLIAPVRLGLALATFALVRVRGVEAGVAGGIFALGAGLLVFAVLASARRRRTWARIAEAGTAPANARVEPRRRSLLAATYPSTIGLTGLTGIALVANTRLAALLAGILPGSGLRPWDSRPSSRPGSARGMGACSSSAAGAVAPSCGRASLSTQP